MSILTRCCRRERLLAARGSGAVGAGNAARHRAAAAPACRRRLDWRGWSFFCSSTLRCFDLGRLALGFDARVHVEHLPKRQDQHRQRDGDEEDCGYFPCLLPRIRRESSAFNLAEGGGEHVLPPDDHIVIARCHVTCSMDAHRLFEAPADAVAYDRVSGLFGDREADTRRCVVAAVQHFEQEKPPAPLFATADGQEFAALAQPPQHWSPRGGRCPATIGLPSGGQPLAAAVAASCDDAAAALGGHAGTEAVPALADEFRGLIGALHLF